MAGLLHPRTLVHEARELAEALLAELPERCTHTRAVAVRAAELAGTVPDDECDLLLSAAWLHDIGYAEPLRDTGFHPLDGARHLARTGWPARLAALVAHHSGAWYVADAQGIAGLLAGYPREQGPLPDALAYADQTVGPYGRRVAVRARMAEMLARHGPGSAQAKAHRLRGPYLLGVAERVERRLASTGPARRPPQGLDGLNGDRRSLPWC
jgi:hypothetical protein